MRILAKTTLKDIIITLPDKKNLQFFIELLSDTLRFVEFSLSYKLGNMKIRLIGDRESVMQSIETVKTLSRMFSTSVVPDKEGFYAHHLKLIQQVSTRIVSLESIATVLNVSGYSSRVIDQTLISKAKIEEIKEIVLQLYEIIQQIPNNVRIQAMKRVILAVCYKTQFLPDFVIDKGLKNNYFREHNSSLSLTESPENVIVKLIDDLSKEEVKNEFNKNHLENSVHSMKILSRFIEDK